MIIDALSMLDFRAFSGLHHFELTPRIRRNKAAPIVLFGGLNGGGKTTSLSAIKLALYGKGAIGRSASIADYHQYLRECIHRAPNGIVQPTRSAVELSFRYAQHGVVNQYHVKRDWWIERSDKVKEGLLISRDGMELAELSYDQAQSFLNELIPIGVSELFFFDGEKIANLAEETSGEALKDSINKLLGLDIVDRLDSDLAVLIRTRASRSASHERRLKIDDATADYQKLRLSLEEKKLDLIQANIEIGEAERNILQITGQISARGGAWSASRKEESSKLDELSAKKRVLEDQLRELASGLLPLALPRKLIAKAKVQLDSERKFRSARSMAVLVRRQESAFLKAMRSALPFGEINEDAVRGVYLDTFRDILDADSSARPPIHDLSDSRIASVEHRVDIALIADSKRAASICAELETIDSDIDSIGANIARAPEEDVLAPLFAEQTKHSELLGGIKARRDRLVEDIKDVVNRMSQVGRHLDDMHSEAAKAAESDRVFAIASQARDALKQFATRARETKLKALEKQFFESFNRLARKEDRHLSIQIDPASFEVRLQDEDGTVIRKQELSAGEKQIYAISVLEALARTSGRSLPVIIDTPLGRLDSIHRQKLVENYFPKTSHQVVILSTDTEIDRSFYKDLSPHISHAYHLIYEPSTRSTTVEEGYFWRDQETA